MNGVAKDYQQILLSIDESTDENLPKIRVLNGDNKEIDRPDIIQRVTQLAQLGQLVKIRKSLEREHFKGLLDNRRLGVTEEYQVLELLKDWPWEPWASASFFNDGPDTAHININRRSEEFTLKIGENAGVDLSKADHRIETIHYWCDKGETASVRVIGKY